LGYQAYDFDKEENGGRPVSGGRDSWDQDLLLFSENKRILFLNLKNIKTEKKYKYIFLLVD
jgi:hypothetical protein